MRRSRVLVVDDSALMRTMLCEIFSRAEGLEVAGAAPDAFIAWEQIKALEPDVLTLDVEMPRMDGLSFLEKLMRLAPMPVIMVSAQGTAARRALELGAVDFVPKPRLDAATGKIASGELVEKVRAAAARRRPARKIVAIGASTGGTEALAELLAALPPDGPAVLVAQHMPERFTRAFAERLDGICALRVAEAVDGEPILPGRVLVAPGDRHLAVRMVGGTPRVELRNTPPVNRHRPSVDVLFESCVALGPEAVGVILTGMGNDGARGLLAMRQAGARTFAQDEASSVVFGMPKAAIACGAAEEIRPLAELPAAMLRVLA